MPTILGANTLSSGYDVANSLRFNAASEDHIDRTPSSAGNQKKFTFSTWVKRSRVGAGSGPEEFIMYGRPGTNTDTRLYFTGDGNANDDRLYFQSTTDNTTHTALQTNRKFRDTSAWYNIVISVNTEDGNGSSSTIKMFINGVQETSFATETYGVQNKLFYWTDDALTTIGRRSENNGQHFSGYIAETVLIDGQALDADSFGEFDDDSPTVWKPKDVSGLTFGTNGFYLEFKQNGTSQNSSGLGADTSGNDQHFALSGLNAQSQSLDTCTNNYATFLGETMMRSNATFTNGNLKYNAPASNPVFGSLSTFGVESGKWYAEVKYLTGTNHYLILGIADEVFATLNDLGSATNTDLGKTGAALGSHPVDCTIAYVVNTGAYRSNNNNTSWGSGGGDGDIINIALDRDNRKVYFGVNGTYGNSSDPANGTGGIDLSSLVTGDTYFLGVTNDTGASETTAEFNFGAGATTAISSGNSDANGHGNFEYAVPSGYYAWNTKNLAEFG